MKPFAALLIVPPHAGDDLKNPGSLRFVPVRVDVIDRAMGRARVAQRFAGKEESKWVSFDLLATTPAIAMAKAEKHLSPLLARAPLNAMAVTTAGAENTPKSLLHEVAANQGQNPAPGEEVH
jgi:hypothetical protein